MCLLIIAGDGVTTFKGEVQGILKIIEYVQKVVS